MLGGVILGGHHLSAQDPWPRFSVSRAHAADADRPAPPRGEALDSMVPAFPHRVHLIAVSDQPFQPPDSLSQPHRHLSSGGDAPAATTAPARADPPPLWCQSVLDRALDRPAGDHLIATHRRWQLQRGLPKSLSSDHPGPAAAQVVLFLADEDLRLLSFRVGVPDTDEAERWIDQALLEQADQTRPQLIDQLAESLEPRYAEALRQFESAHEMEDDDTGVDGGELDPAPEAIGDLINQLSRRFDPVYWRDLQNRFDLRPATAKAEAALWQQHAATRRQWCQCVSMYLDGLPLQSVMMPITGWVWQSSIIEDREPSPAVLSFWQLRFDGQVRVLARRNPPGRGAEEIGNPPGREPRKPSGTGDRSPTWTNLRRSIRRWPVMEVDATDLLHLQLTSTADQTPLPNLTLDHPSAWNFLLIGKQNRPLLTRPSMPAGVTRARISRVIGTVP